MSQQKTVLRAFHSDPALKCAVIKQVKDKIAKGQLVHGTYGEERDGMMRGCAVFVSTCVSQNAHQVYEDKYGVPIAIARLKDVIYEGLKAPHDKEWPVKFWEAITPGADLSRVAPKLLYWIVTDTLRHEQLWRKQDKKDEYATKVVAAIKRVLDVVKVWADTGVVGAANAAYAAHAVYAAHAAANAADAADAANAANAANAAYAVYAAHAAADAANAANAVYAAHAAADAANAANAAYADFYIHCSKKLLELLKEAA